MNIDDINKMKEAREPFEILCSFLNEEYLLIKKNKLTSLVGGAIAFIITTGIIGYGSAHQALLNNSQSITIKNALKDAKDISALRETLVDDIKTLKSLPRYGGIYQKAQNGDDHNQVKNSLTGDHTCPDRYDPYLIGHVVGGAIREPDIPMTGADIYICLQIEKEGQQ